MLSVQPVRPGHLVALFESLEWIYISEYPLRCAFSALEARNAEIELLREYLPIRTVARENPEYALVEAFLQRVAAQIQLRLKRMCKMTRWQLGALEASLHSDTSGTCAFSRLSRTARAFRRGASEPHHWTHEHRRTSCKAWVGSSLPKQNFVLYKTDLWAYPNKLKVIL